MIRVYSNDPRGFGEAWLGVIHGKIISIELLEGQTETTDPEVVQYVNIKENPAEHIDGNDVTHVDRLGQKLRCKVKFDKPGNFSFKVKLIPDGNNSVYSASELGRNPNFKFSDEEVTYTTDSNGEKIIEDGRLFVSPAGGDVFTISATHGDKTVTATSKIVTKRYIHYVEMKMSGLTSAVTNLTIFENEYDKYGVVFNKLEPLPMNFYMPNINQNEQDVFGNNILATFKGSSAKAKTPYCLAIAYTEQLAAIEANVPITVSGVTGGGEPVDIDIIVDTKRLALWNKIDDQDWFVSCQFHNSTGDVTLIAKEKCVPFASATGYYPEEYCDRIKIDISSLPKELGTIKLVVNCVSRWRSGLAFDGNVVTVSTKSHWTQRADSEQIKTLAHEVGHKLGMAVDGTDDLDRSPHYYYLNGGHCNNDGNTCVMYGKISSTRKDTFCAWCAGAVKKVDLSKGF